MPKQSNLRLMQGGLVDRQRPLNFYFNGRPYQGYQGDTLASALLANGIHLLGRGMKFHRPRGIVSAGVEECNALVTLGQGGYEETSVRATIQPLYEGLRAKSQNCWPSVKWDMGVVLDWLSPLFPAGFYNKTFIWPNWHWYEDAIRRTAGLGTLPPADDPDSYCHRHEQCDVLVCGGGAAGLSAALSAARAGAKVLLVEQSQQLGGELAWNPSIQPLASADWLAETLTSLDSHPNVHCLTDATASACFDHNMVMVAEKVTAHHLASDSPRERLWKIRATKIILATGAIEQPLVFPNNDRPGIMLASSVQQYLQRFGVLAGRTIVIATNNDSAYSTALALTAAGATVPCIIDNRSESSVGICAEDYRSQGIALYFNSTLMQTYGRKRVNAVRIGDIQSGKTSTDTRLIACDTVAMSGGWQGAVHLFSQAKGKLHYSEAHSSFLPRINPDNLVVVGAANGTVDLATSIAEGERSGVNAAVALGLVERSAPSLNQNNDRNSQAASQPTYNTQRIIPAINPAQQWLDFQHDVTLQDIDIAVQEDYCSVEHLKRYTTTGMSVDQGKTSNINALTALAERTGNAIEKVGTTTFRPFYMPVTLGAIAGRRKGERYAPTRQSPMLPCYQNKGAELWDYGHWRRPAAYPEAGENLFQAMQREALAVRRSVGIYDGSPLGKIAIRGPDAAEFLNRFYINNVHTLKEGRARYGIMLNESGIVIDDGIFVRLSEHHFLVHTTSGNAEHILAWFEEWHQCEWPELQVIITPVTTQWANATLSGPNARKVLQKLNTDIDLDNEAFPHMSLREGCIQIPATRTQGAKKIPLRIMRASFTGELGYEINIPANYGAALWHNLLQAGAEFGITRYGVESLMILRSEKGYLHVGADTDGTTVPDDIGWGGPVSKKQADFIGKRSLLQPENCRQQRRQFVGIRLEDAGQALVSGMHIVAEDKAATVSEGYVTSAFYSPHLSCWIGLAMVNAGRSRLGESVSVFHAGKHYRAKLVEPVFFDQEGGRIHV